MLVENKFGSKQAQSSSKNPGGGMFSPREKNLNPLVNKKPEAPKTPKNKEKKGEKPTFKDGKQMGDIAKELTKQQQQHL